MVKALLIASKRRDAGRVVHGSSTKCSSRFLESRICYGGRLTSTAPSSTSYCKRGVTKSRPNAFQACAAVESGSAQDRHCSVARPPGGQNRNPGAREREAHVRQSCSPAEQPGREQPSTDARTGAPHARLSRPDTHAQIPIVLRSHPATFRAQAASVARRAL